MKRIFHLFFFVQFPFLPFQLIIDESADPAPADIEHRELRLTYFQKRNIHDKPVNVSFICFINLCIF